MEQLTSWDKYSASSRIKLDSDKNSLVNLRNRGERCERHSTRRLHFYLSGVPIGVGWDGTAEIVKVRVM